MAALLLAPAEGWGPFKPCVQSGTLGPLPLYLIGICGAVEFLQVLQLNALTFFICMFDLFHFRKL